MKRCAEILFSEAKKKQDKKCFLSDGVDMLLGHS